MSKKIVKIVLALTITAITFTTCISLFMPIHASTKDIDKPVQTTTVTPNVTTITTPTTTPTITTSTTATTTTKSVTTTKSATTATTTTTTAITTTTPKVEPTYINKNMLAKRKSNWLFIGDSRFEFWYKWGLYGTYIAKSGQGLSVIYDNYDEIISYRNYNIVFNLGANQWWSGLEYVNLLNSLPDEFTKNNHIIVMSVTPTDGRFYWMNTKFDEFNQILKSNLRSDFEYVDASQWMKDKGFNTADGLHYTTSQDYLTYDFLVNNKV